MEWLHVFTIVGSTVGCCLYFRKESQADLKEVKDEIRSMEARSESHMSEFRKETKDFHGRMCALEEKYQQLKKNK